MGRPKALVRDDAGRAWVALACGLLRDAGCDPVVVVLGAEAATAAALVPDWARVAVAEDWADGMSASLRHGLDAVAATDADAVLVTLVDLPAATTAAAGRVLAETGPAGAAALARATYRGRPGHPVLIGRSHWPALRASLAGDAGAGRYLVEHHAVEVECGDLGGGDDVDVIRPTPRASGPAADSA